VSSQKTPKVNDTSGTQALNGLHGRALGAVKKLYRHGLGFEAVANQFNGEDQGLLRELYGEAAIPTTEQSAQSLARVKNTPQAPQIVTSKPIEPSVTNTQRPTAAGRLASQSNSNREAYLARLAAVRARKPAGPSELLPQPTPALTSLPENVDPAATTPDIVKLDSSAPRKPLIDVEGVVLDAIAIQQQEKPKPAEGPGLSSPIATKPTVISTKPGLTELVRQRLEALKKSGLGPAKPSTPTNCNVNSKESGVSSPSSIEYSSARGSNTPEQIATKPILTRLAQPPMIAPSSLSKTVSPTIPKAIPGLFMAPPPLNELSVTAIAQSPPEDMEITTDSSANKRTLPSPAPGFLAVASLPGVPNSSRRRPISADFMDSRPVSQTQPYMPNTHLQRDETCVIELTDEDSEEDSDEDGEDGEDGEGTMAGPSAYEKPAIPNPLNNPSPKLLGLTGNSRPALFGRVHSFPTSAFHSPAPVPSPDQIARNEQLKRHEVQIALEKKRLRERIAQMEQRKRAKLLTVSSSESSSTPTSTKVSTPALPAILSEPIPDVAAGGDAVDLPAVPANGSVTKQDATVVQPSAVPSLATPRFSTISPGTQAEPKELKRKRQAELDADVAMNRARIEELQREMRKLEEENLRKTQDRQQLAKELEDMGIDTQGMSHEDLQTTKDEIEQQQAVTTEGDAALTNVDDTTPASYSAFGESNSPTTHLLPPQLQSQDQAMDDVHEEDVITDQAVEEEVKGFGGVESTVQVPPMDGEADDSMNLDTSKRTSISNSIDENENKEIEGVGEGEWEPSPQAPSMSQPSFAPDKYPLSLGDAVESEESMQDMDLDDDEEAQDHEPDATSPAADESEDSLPEMLADDLAPELQRPPNGTSAAQTVV
jgi:hypothetical protein